MSFNDKFMQQPLLVRRIAIGAVFVVGFLVLAVIVGTLKAVLPSGGSAPSSVTAKSSRPAAVTTSTTTKTTPPAALAMQKPKKK